MTQRTLAITLFYKTIGEDDRLYTLYTLESGKLTLLAKGARKIMAKLSAHLEPPSLADCLVARGKRHDHLAGAETVFDFKILKSNAQRRYLALEAARLVDLLTPAENPEEAVFNLLLNFYRYLEQEKIKIDSLALFSVKLLEITGHGRAVRDREPAFRRVSEILGQEYRPYLT